MDGEVKSEALAPAGSPASSPADASAAPRKRASQNDAKRRRCVSTACIACRKRKSKCDGAVPSCAACTSVYNTPCVYDPSSDHRRKGVYKKDIDGLRTRNSTLQTLIQAILNYPEDDVPELVRKIRTCESLDKIAEQIAAEENGADIPEEEPEQEQVADIVINGSGPPTFESHLANKMGELRLDNGSVRMIGGTSNLLYLDEDDHGNYSAEDQFYPGPENPVTSWTTVTKDPELVKHLLNHYFTWHYTFFTILPRLSFERDFARGRRGASYSRATQYCSSLLVNAMLALGCHFSSSPGARADPADSATAGDHFFNEAKRLIYEQDLLDIPRLSTIQALALMSVREAGCAREARGWVYSGMAFRMACDLGLSFNSSASLHTNDLGAVQDDEELDARRITFWGCFMIDKCWSNYLGRLPIFQTSANITVPKFEVFPTEDAAPWCPYSESGFSSANKQPSRVRAVALQMSALCDISSDLIGNFYHPEQFENPPTKQIEVKRLSEIHSRLEEWRRNLPKELEPKEGTLASVIIMHMFFQVLYIHLFRPFLKYNQATSPLPNNVSPRKFCTQAAAHISKLLRLYKRSHGLRQIVNIAVYITHSACTIHLLNLPDKNAKRDIIHGVKSLEEIAEGWLCARRTLCVISAQAKKWHVELPEEAASILSRTDAKFGALSSTAGSSPEKQSSPEQQARAVFHDQLQASQSASATAFLQYSKGTASSVASVQTPLHASLGPLPPHTPAQSQPVSPYEKDDEMQKLFQGFANQGKNSMLPPRQQAQARQTQVQSNWTVPQRPTVPHQQTRKRPLQSESEPMFGGVEALLREGQDWWLKDQSALATGFDNWNFPATGHRPSIGGGMPSPEADGRMASMNSMNQYGGRNGYTAMAGQAMAGQPQGTMYPANDGAGGNGQSDFTGMTATFEPSNGAGTGAGFAYPSLFSNSNTYNESEWYQ